MSFALEHLTVIDLTQVMAGPFCCQLLGDLGADVIKVEPVGRGDATGHRMSHGTSAAFLAVNRNKRSIALDLRADAAVKLGVDYPAVRDINERTSLTTRDGHLTSRIHSGQAQRDGRGDQRVPPRLGKHTDEILGAVGYSADEIRRDARRG